MAKERERNRIKSRIDELPPEVVNIINQKLSDVTYTYQDIADAVKDMGYEISKSSIGRYALRQNKASSRLKEACETTKVLVEAMKDNKDLDASEAATTIIINELTKKFATAQEEFEAMPLDKAGRLIVAIQRSAVYKEKFKLEYKKGINEAIRAVKEELSKELKNETELFKRMCELTDRVSSKMECENDV